MRSLVTALVVLLIFPSRGVAQLPLRDGFRQFKWGEKPRRGILKIGMKANMDVFVLPWQQENPRVAGIDGARITYFYYRDRLCRIEVQWGLLGEAENKTIPAALTREWGDPPEVDVIGSRTWKSLSGRTEAHLSGLDDPRTAESDFSRCS